jgi:hypothetical protein
MNGELKSIPSSAVLTRVAPIPLNKNNKENWKNKPMLPIETMWRKWMRI